MQLLAVALALATAAAAPHRTKLAVLDVQSTTEEARPTAKLLTQVVVGEFAKDPALSVISSQEITQALGFARQKQLLGCNDNDCLAEIGGALGVDYLVTGQLGRIGSRYRVDLRLVRANQGRIVASAGDFVAGTDDALADGTVRLARALHEQLPSVLRPGTSGPPASAISQAGPTTEVGASAPPPDRTGAYVALGAAAALAVGAALMTKVTADTYDDVAHNRPGAQASSLKWKGPVADGLWVLAATSAGVGTYLFFSAHPAEKGSGGEVAVGGRF